MMINFKEKNEVVFTNENWKNCLIDPELTWGAKGLYAYLVNFPEHIALLNILRFSKEDQGTTQAYLEELEKAGYLAIGSKQEAFTIKQK